MMRTIIQHVPEASTEVVLLTRNTPRAVAIQKAYQGGAMTWAKEVMEVLHHSRLHHSRAQWNNSGMGSRNRNDHIN